MKKILTIIVTILLCIPHANALLISVRGYGEIDENGMTLTIEEGEQDPLSGKYVMSLGGDILATGNSLAVTITRSERNINDEFCCAGQCQTGNGQYDEQLTYTIREPQTWYVHYMPTDDSDVTLTYVFTDETESRTLTVRYIRKTQSIPHIEAEQTSPVYTITGTNAGNVRLHDLPAGLFIHNHNKYLKTY